MRRRVRGAIEEDVADETDDEDEADEDAADDSEYEEDEDEESEDDGDEVAEEEDETPSTSVRTSAWSLMTRKCSVSS